MWDFFKEWVPILGSFVLGSYCFVSILGAPDFGNPRVKDVDMGFDTQRVQCVK